jgi:hypothetical protein
MRKLILMAAVLVCGMSFATAATYHVAATSGAHPSGTGTIADPFDRITEGLAAATTPGDVVRIAEGLYDYEPSTLTLRNGVTVEGAWSSDFTTRSLIDHETIYDAGKAHRAFVSRSKTGWTLDGLTIRNGEATSIGGGGLLVTNTPNNAEPDVPLDATPSEGTIVECTFFNNTCVNAGANGGAIHVSNHSELTMTDCALTSNAVYSEPPDTTLAASGGAMSIQGNGIVTIERTLVNENKLGPDCDNGDSSSISYRSASPFSTGTLNLINCIIVDNEALNVNGPGGHGNLLRFSCPTLNVINCTIDGNSTLAPSARFIREYAESTTATYTHTWVNNIISNNTSPGNTGFQRMQGDWTPADKTLVWQNNIFFNNLAGAALITPRDKAEQATILGANNNEEIDPLYVNQAGGDLHLTGTSPGVDAGVTRAESAVDFEGLARPSGSAYDIGAFEFDFGPGINRVPDWMLF